MSVLKLFIFKRQKNITQLYYVWDNFFSLLLNVLTFARRSKNEVPNSSACLFLKNYRRDTVANTLAWLRTVPQRSITRRNSWWRCRHSGYSNRKMWRPCWVTRWTSTAKQKAFHHRVSRGYALAAEHPTIISLWSMIPTAGSRYCLMALCGRLPPVRKTRVIIYAGLTMASDLDWAKWYMCRYTVRIRLMRHQRFEKYENKILTYLFDIM